ncbi:3-phosphoshikimate 1-carboxyvinyltransferase [Brevibacillus centrosporus]|uniref:3-phosphoshikimate 1-carboxyvinyltransferase n=1 Tax=Brevibacillus centrosporus TaxID=54910 RepID=A0A1I4E6Z5_9BACL|nr:3-phosphoshikimate 1-carboxyvinyltransferase [Brevibacillus centrosporus]SFL00116.1 3-phosphoshikimate 1-carboxyvinyltransferase [Brevibacillus centrosporus]
MNSFLPDFEARSEWASLHDVKVAEVSPSLEPICIEMRVPGSKSFTNRAMIVGALANGTSKFFGILRSDDSYWCIDTLRKLGVDITVDDDVVEIKGVNTSWPVKDAKLYIGAAGTTARFLPGALAVSSSGRWIIQGSKRMNERPMSSLIEALRNIGADIRCLNEEGYLPIEITGNGISGGVVNMSGSTSSQFISGVLLASTYAKEPVTIQIVDHIVQQSYVKITINLMRQFGVKVEHDEDLKRITVYPGEYIGREMQLEADASTSGYFFGLAAITNGKVRITNLSYDTFQPDIKLVDVLEKMGCRVERGNGYIELQGTPHLKGGFDISMKEMSDQTLTLAAIAPFADGPIAIHDVAHIRKHESDRIHVICESLKQMGIQVEEREDGLTVYPGHPKATVLNSYDDHRVAMSLAMIGARVPGIRITDPGSVSKTCPTFFEELKKLGLQVKLEK